MPEIGTSSSMSGDRKRGVGHRPQATAPILDSTKSTALAYEDFRRSFQSRSILNYSDIPGAHLPCHKQSIDPNGQRVTPRGYGDTCSKTCRAR